MRETNVSAGGCDVRTRAGEHSTRRSALAYDRAGAGEPLVLLHGLGSSRRSWDPVLPGLVGEREVIAVDLPGYGDSPLDRTRPGHTPGDLADSVAGLLDDLGLATAHLGGNSLGGWVALEMAKRGRARTVTAFSPAGLWQRSAPAYIRASLRQSRVNARIVHRLAPNAPRTRLARALLPAGPARPGERALPGRRGDTRARHGDLRGR